MKLTLVCMTAIVSQYIYQVLFFVPALSGGKQPSWKEKEGQGEKKWQALPEWASDDAVTISSVGSFDSSGTFTAHKVYVHTCGCGIGCMVLEQSVYTCCLDICMHALVVRLCVPGVELGSVPMPCAT